MPKSWWWSFLLTAWRVVQLLFTSAVLCPNRGVFGVKITQFEVPSQVSSGQSAILKCNYELENSDELWRVKFYKDYDTFYCYYPTGLPKVFSPNSQNISIEPVSGISVNIEMSFANIVQLDNITMKSSGLYHCEIKTSTFQSAFAKKRMRVRETEEEPASHRGCCGDDDNVP